MKFMEGFINKLIVFIILFFVYSCTPITLEEREKRNCINSFKSEIKKNNNLRFFYSTNSSFFGEKIFCLRFFSYDKLDLSETRRFLVDNVESFLLKCIDNTLTNCEFKDIEFSIMFIKKEGGFVESPNIASVFLNNGIIHYRIYNPISDDLETSCGESYQKALGMVEHQKNLEQIASWETAQ